VFGYFDDKEKYYKNNATRHKAKRQFCLENIGMAVSPHTGKLTSQAKLERDWITKGIKEKNIVLRKVREERERFVRYREREKETKSIENYRPPENKDAKRRSVAAGCGSHGIAIILGFGRTEYSFSNSYTGYGGPYGKYNSRYRRSYEKRFRDDRVPFVILTWIRKSTHC
jgi:hypothetical protein